MSASALFAALHRGSQPLLLPNPWDVGSARLFVSLGFQALATTSTGFAASRGQSDGDPGADASLAYAAQIAAAVTVPVSADLEDGYGAGPDEVAAVYERAVRMGLAGASIEDSVRAGDDPIRPMGEAVDRVRAAAEAAHAADPTFVLTGRAENHLHGREDLADTIARLQAYQEAGADVLYAPGLTRARDIRTLVASVDRPVNVLARAGGPEVAKLAELGVARISVGGAFAFAGYAAAAAAAREFLHLGTYAYARDSRAGHEAMAEAVRTT